MNTFLHLLLHFLKTYQVAGAAAVCAVICGFVLYRKKGDCWQAAILVMGGIIAVLMWLVICAIFAISTEHDVINKLLLNQGEVLRLERDAGNHTWLLTVDYGQARVKCHIQDIEGGAVDAALCPLAENHGKVILTPTDGGLYDLKISIKGAERDEVGGTVLKADQRGMDLYEGERPASAEKFLELDRKLSMITMVCGEDEAGRMIPCNR